MLYAVCRVLYYAVNCPGEEIWARPQIHGEDAGRQVAGDSEDDYLVSLNRVAQRLVKSI